MKNKKATIQLWRAKMLWVMIFIGVFIMCLSTISASVSQPVAYWKFDDASGTSALDSVTGKYNLTMATSNNWTTGLINGAYWLNTADNINTTNPYLSNESSFSLWINRTGTIGTSGILIGSQDGGFANGEFRVSPATGEVLVFDAKDSVGGTVSIITAPITLNAWTHLVGTINTTGISLYVNNVLNASKNFGNSFSFIDRNVTIGGGGGNNQKNIKIDEFGVWNTSLNSSAVSTLWNNGAGGQYPSFLPIGSTLGLPGDKSIILSDSINLSSTNSGSSLINATLYIWNSTSNIINQTTQSLIGGITNPSWVVLGFKLGNYSWNVNVCDATSCTFAPSNYTFTYGYNFSTSIFNATSYEMMTEGFTQNLSVASSVTPTSATLMYAGTGYSGTISNSTANNYTLKTSVALPLGATNNTFYWNVTFNDGQTRASSTSYQNTSLVSLTLCGASPQNVPYLNFTFKNETNAQETVNAAFTGTFNYWFSSSAYSKTLTFTNSSENPSYAFCFSPASRPININLTSVYSNGYSPQRGYNLGTTSLSNATTNTTLYLLPSSLGSYVTFLVSNAALQNIQGGMVNISRSGIGLIEQGTTDSAGSVTFFMNPLFSYTVQASASGYPVFSQSITPTQSTYTISLGSNTLSSGVQNYNNQISYTIEPTDLYLMNETTYEFNLTLNSTFWTVQGFGFNILNSSGDILSSASSSNNGGFVSLNYNTANWTALTMNYWWQINNTNVSYNKYYIIISTEASEHSVTSLVTRLKTYLTGGMFGLTTFSLNLIVFFIILIVTGIMSYKFGLTSPAAILGVMTGLLLLFDPILGLVTYPTTFWQTIHAGSLMMVLITIVFTIREAY